jgi:hypothetical protein
MARFEFCLDCEITFARLGNMCVTVVVLLIVAHNRSKIVCKFIVLSFYPFTKTFILTTFHFCSFEDLAKIGCSLGS